MSTQNYRPAIGEMLFAVLYDNDPALITVTGYHEDKRFSSEQIDYLVNGKARSSSLSGMVFYPDAPIDSCFFYTVVVEESEFMEPAQTTKLGIFFKPEDAFQFIEDIESGSIKPHYVSKGEFVDHMVIVEKV